MTLLNGTQNDGFWNYTFYNYPVNESIFYRVLAEDAFGNWNATGYYSFGYFDTLGPNIISVFQVPTTPTYQDIVNVTAHIMDATQVQSVSILTNYTGTLSSYTMTLISGSSDDGVWKFSFNNYPLNKIIMYQLNALDIFGNINLSSSFNFGVFDLNSPSIISVLQTPSPLTKWEAVKVVVHVQENFALGAVTLDSNYTGSWATYSMTQLNGTLQDGFWEYTILKSAYTCNRTISYHISATDVAGRTTTTSDYNFGIFPIISYYVPLTITIKVDIGKGASRKGDITFNFRNTGNTHWANLSFTINIPTGWTIKPSACFVSQLAPGQNVTITFKLTLPKNVSEAVEIILIDVSAVISETGLEWTIPQPIQVFISKSKVGDFFIWVIVIVGSASAAVATSYVYIHKRSASTNAPKIKVKGKSLASLKAVISTDFPGSYGVVSVELMERISTIKGLTDEERQLLIEDVAQLDEEASQKWIDAFEKSLEK